MWNWKKITNNLNELPAFGKPVMLYWKDDKKKFAVVGVLKSLDAEGLHWGTNDSPINLFDFLNVITSKVLKPTHYCEIETPDDEQPEQDRQK